MLYKAVFELFQKNTFANLCKPIHDIINYSNFIFPFKSRKCEKEGGKLQKFEFLDNEKSPVDGMKSIFHSFWKAIIWEKNKQQTQVLKRFHSVFFNRSCDINQGMWIEKLCKLLE